MNNFLGTIERFSKPSVMFFSFLFFAIIIVFVNVIFVPGFKYLTQTFNYTPEKAYLMLSEYGEAGRIVHLKVLIADIFMVMLYTVFFSTSIYSTFSRLLNNREIVLVLCLVPFALALIQLTEVTGVFSMLINYPAKMLKLAGIISITTMIKFTFTYICFLLPLIGFIGLVIRKLFVKT